MQIIWDIYETVNHKKVNGVNLPPPKKNTREDMTEWDRGSIGNCAINWIIIIQPFDICTNQNTFYKMWSITFLGPWYITLWPSGETFRDSIWTLLRLQVQDRRNEIDRMKDTYHVTREVKG